jgi:hypothetical protein
MVAVVAGSVPAPTLCIRAAVAIAVGIAAVLAARAERRDSPIQGGRSRSRERSSIQPLHSHGIGDRSGDRSGPSRQSERRDSPIRGGRSRSWERSSTQPLHSRGSGDRHMKRWNDGPYEMRTRVGRSRTPERDGSLEQRDENTPAKRDLPRRRRAYREDRYSGVEIMTV